MYKAINELKDFVVREKLASELDKIQYSEETVASRRTCKKKKKQQEKPAVELCVYSPCVKPELELR